MKSRIFMYLFIFTLLLVLFQFINSKSIIEDYDKNLKTAENRVEAYQDSIAMLRDDLLEFKQFDLRYSDDAISFFQDNGINSEKLMPVVTDALLSMNMQKGNDHPLIPYPGGNGNRMLLNSVKFLNHKWLIADFSDGTLWGEILVGYSIDDNNDIKFKEIETLLYPYQSY
jgi:hypothetical protein